MIVAVTGAFGNVGTAVATALRGAGHEVIAVDRRGRAEAELVAAEFSTMLSGLTGQARAVPRPGGGAEIERTTDLQSHEETRRALDGADAVVHLAAIAAPIVAPEWEVHNNNVVSSYNVLSAAAELGIPRVVQSSSVNAIGLAWSRQPAFDYFPIDLAHASRNEDGYSLSKLAQEMQADSITRRHDGVSVVSLRLHAVLEDASEAQAYIDRLGNAWAVNGLFGYCTTASVVNAVLAAITAPITQHERLWVVEPETFMAEPSRGLAGRFFPDVPIVGPFSGRASFFDTSRTRRILNWEPSTASSPPIQLASLI